MTTYILDNTNSDLAGGADFSKKLVTSSPATGTISPTIALSATETSYGFTEPGVPGILGNNTGDFSAELNVTTGNTNIQLSVSFSRVNSSGTVQATSSATAEQQATAGVKTFTVTNPVLGTWAAGDRLRVNYIIRNTAAMSQSLDFGVGTTDSEVVIPDPAGGSTHFMYYQRRRRL